MRRIVLVAGRPMTSQEFKENLVGRKERQLVLWLLSSKPKLFGSPEDYASWQNTLLAASKLGGGKLALLGSAATGFSLAPRKFGRPFSRVATSARPASDLDIAITSAPLFIQAWDAILEADRSFALRLTADERDKLRQDVYYGFISDEVTPKNSEAFRIILSMRSASGRHPVSSGIRANFRIYRREVDLIGYQVSSMRALTREMDKKR